MKNRNSKRERETMKIIFSIAKWLPFALFVVAVFPLLMAGCSSGQPDWITEIPPSEDGYMYFVGVSKNSTVRQKAREDATINAADRIVKYYGIDIENNLKEAIVTHGLASDVVDPTVASIEIKKAMSKGIVRRLRIIEWYEEKTENEKEWVSYGLGAIPEKQVEEAYAEAVQMRIAAMRAKKADEQVDKAVKMFDDLAEGGLMSKPKE